MTARAMSARSPVIRNRQVERQWRLLIQLANFRRGATLESLRAAILDLGDRPVSERTLRRDLEALAGAGFSVVSARDEGRTYWTLEEQSIVERLHRRRIADSTSSASTVVEASL